MEFSHGHTQDSQFPVSYSTLAPEALAAWLEVAYGINGCECSFILRGVGDTYLVHNVASKYILRVYRHGLRTRAHVERETDLLDKLRESGVSVSFPLRDVDGKLINVLHAPEGDRLAVLFSFAEGRSFHLMSDEQLTSLGKEVATYHTISAREVPVAGDRVFTTETMLHEPLRRVRPYFASAPEDLRWLEESFAKIEAKINRTDTSAFGSGFIQFDLLPKNYHFDAGNRVTLFDFDFLGHGWLLLDLMTFWVHIQLDIHVGRQPKEEGERSFMVFVEAYRSVRPISDTELELIPWISLGFWIFYMGFHESHDGFYGFVKEPAHLKVRMGLIRGLLKGYL
ncbi:MAG: hypothetical protein EOO09_02125 [Chitinophagaceae bacterium]|nr:MAG: hypothetical protein EOO09_02125 [Chitinophagaceae bacterium]